MEVNAEGLARFFELVLPHLNERQRRVLAGAAAEMLGNKTVVAEAAGMSRNTVIKAEAEVVAGMEPQERQRPPGAGQKPITEAQPGILEDLDALVHPDTRGDPMSLLRWTSKSTYKLADELVRQGYKVSADSVGRLLKRLGYSLQAPSKQKEGTRHPDRDRQFRYLNKMAGDFLAEGQPAISVDTKKKEPVGEFSNGGREWQLKGEPEEVNVHDFVDQELGRAVPYGVYDLANDEGWVSVGDNADTAEFAVNSIRAWWANMGSPRFPGATRLLITADAGGSNGYRLRAWKSHLAKLAEELGLDITVCHYPPGTSKWNKIEHRMFSFITMNWRGRPLVSYRTIVELISATETKSLTLRADLDPRTYDKGVKVSDAELAAVPLEAHSWHGEWNYTIKSHAQTIER
ncbi:MAG: ISAzo13 family transposase [Acidimicrobiales bacterium]